ncbi:hypothetical protein P7C73_g2183, partial [Tremellales sp. Uapishka_1]
MYTPPNPSNHNVQPAFSPISVTRSTRHRPLPSRSSLSNSFSFAPTSPQVPHSLPHDESLDSESSFSFSYPRKTKAHPQLPNIAYLSTAVEQGNFGMGQVSPRVKPKHTPNSGKTVTRSRLNGEDVEMGEREDGEVNWGMVDSMRLWRHDAIMQHLYETAAFWGDKILSWTGKSKEDDEWWGMEEVSRRLVEESLACRYLAAQCLVQQEKYTEALELLGKSNPFRESVAPGSQDEGIKDSHVAEIQKARHELTTTYGLGDNCDVMVGLADELYSKYKWEDCYTITSNAFPRPSGSHVDGPARNGTQGTDRDARSDLAAGAAASIGRQGSGPVRRGQREPIVWPVADGIGSENARGGRRGVGNPPGERDASVGD